MNRLRETLLATCCIAAIAACSGHVATTVPATTANAAPQAAGGAQNGNFVINGTISAIISPTEFTLSTGPTQCGFIHVTTTSSTTVVPSGFVPAAGANVTASGTGSCSQAMTATTQLTENTMTLGGTVASVSGSTITLNTGPQQCANIHVSVNANTGYTPSTYKPAAGDNATALGYGSCSTSVQGAQLIQGPTTPSTTHVNDYAFYHEDGINADVANSVMQAQYNYAETGSASNGDYGATYLSGVSGLNSVEYIDPNLLSNCPHTYSDQTMPTPAPCSTAAGDFGHFIHNTAADYLHDAAGNRLHIMQSTTNAEDRSNPASSDVQNGVAAMTNFTQTSGYTQVFMDDTQPAIASLAEVGAWATPAVSPYPPQEYKGDASPDTTFTTDMTALIAKSHNPVWINVGFTDPTYNTTLMSATNVYGVVLEGCFTDDGKAYGNDENINSGAVEGFEFIANYMLTATSLHKHSLCLTKTANRTGTVDRMYSFASYLLAYDPTYTVTGSVIPTAVTSPDAHDTYAEHQLQPMAAIKSAGTNVDTLATKINGVNALYTREFEHCFLGKAYQGPCAVLVNATKSAIVLPTPLPLEFVYHHAMQLDNNAWSDGGTATFAASAPAAGASLPAYSATILAP